MKSKKDRKFDLPSFLWSMLTVVIIVIVSFIASSIAFNVKSSETFVGRLSSYQYNSEREACEAFVKNELDGKSTNIEIVKIVSEESITKEQFEEYNFNIDDIEIFLSAEKIKIIYSTGYGDLRETYTYLFKNDEESYNYYTPAVSVGEQLNKSYFDSLFGVETLKNLTIDQKTNTTFRIYNIPIKVSTTSVIEISDNVLHQYFFASIIGKTQGYDIYLIQEENSVSAYTNFTFDEEESGWIYLSPEELDANSVHEFLIPPAIRSLDHTHFTKTKTGFEFNGDKIDNCRSALIREAIKTVKENSNEIFEETGDSEIEKTYNEMFSYLEQAMIDSDLSLSANYTVSNGVISKMTCKESFSFGSINFEKLLSDVIGVEVSAEEKEEYNKFMDVLNNLSMELTAVENYRKYGTTKVTLPEELIELHSQRNK